MPLTAPGQPSFVWILKLEGSLPPSYWEGFWLPALRQQSSPACCRLRIIEERRKVSAKHFPIIAMVDKLLKLCNATLIMRKPSKNALTFLKSTPPWQGFTLTSASAYPCVMLYAPAVWLEKCAWSSPR